MNWEDIVKRGELPGDNVYARAYAKIRRPVSGRKVDVLLQLFEQEGILDENSNPFILAKRILTEIIHLIDEKDIEQMINEYEDEFNRNRPKNDEEME